MAALPTGVEIHNGKIRIWFVYRGSRCREILQGWAITAANIRKAGNLRAGIIGDIQMGTFDYARRFPESKTIKKFTTTQRITTFTELCDLFLKIKKLELSAASHDSLTSRVDTLLRIVGGRTHIADIQHTDLLRYRQELLTGDVTYKKVVWFNKEGRKASTVNNLMGTLCSMLKLANHSKFITHAPYENVKNLRVSHRDPDPLLLHEYQAFINALPRRFALTWIVAIHTGMRHGELCALAWEDIDLKKGEIHVCRNLTAKGLFVPPKTNAGIRTITLLQPALEALNEIHQLTANQPKTDIVLHHREYGRTEQLSVRFVFIPGQQSREKKQYFSKRSFPYSWESGMKRAGVRVRDPYQSRHTYACWLLSSGANPSFIASQMGHENAKMVYEVYSKWISEMNADQVSMLNSRMPTKMSPLCPQRTA